MEWEIKMNESIDIFEAQAALEQDILELRNLGLSDEDIGGYVEFFFEAYFPIVTVDDGKTVTLN